MVLDEESDGSVCSKSSSGDEHAKMAEYENRSECSDSARSQMHAYWTSQISRINVDCDPSENEEIGLNRYFMPDYCSWLDDKLPYITLWSNLCISNLNRHNKDYNYVLPALNRNIIANNNTTNAIAENICSLKKRNRSNLKLSLADFIRKCWNDNRSHG